MAYCVYYEDGFIASFRFVRTATAIHIGKHRVPSDPRSQANDGAVSTMMGDRMGILRAVVLPPASRANASTY